MAAPTTVKTAPVTDARTDLVTMIFALWLMIGLFLDGYAHTNLIDELESFFTPWHAVFYSGFLASAGWVAWLIYKGVAGGRSIREAIPAGYGPTVLGLLLFGLGGIGDGIWHTLFGIEAGIDALLSPTHFMLFTGGILGLSTAIRTSRVRNRGDAINRQDRGPLLLSLLLVTGALAFFAAYMWVPGQSSILEVPYVEAEGAISYFIAGLLVSTVILLVPALIVLRWWRLPQGFSLVTWLVISVAIALSFSMNLAVSFIFGLVGGLAGELAVLTWKPGPENRPGSLLALTLMPLAAWSAFMLAIATGVGTDWAPEIWAGSIVLSGLAAAGLGWIVLPDSDRGPVPLGR